MEIFVAHPVAHRVCEIDCAPAFCEIDQIDNRETKLLHIQIQCRTILHNVIGGDDIGKIRLRSSVAPKRHDVIQDNGINDTSRALIECMTEHTTCNAIRSLD